MDKFQHCPRITQKSRRKKKITPKKVLCFVSVSHFQQQFVSLETIHWERCSFILANQIIWTVSFPADISSRGWVTVSFIRSNVLHACLYGRHFICSKKSWSHFTNRLSMCGYPSALLVCINSHFLSWFHLTRKHKSFLIYLLQRVNWGSSQQAWRLHFHFTPCLLSSFYAASLNLSILHFGLKETE